MTFRSLICFAFLTTPIAATAQFNHSQVFFDSSGTDQAAYGGNQIITISGNVTYYGRRDPRPEGGPEVVRNISQEFVQPASDVYLVRHGYWHGNQSPNFHLFLKDVSGSPNTVLGLGGGGFFEQQIASTAPQGLLMSGEYDLVVDEHQNGYFEPHFDLYLGGKGMAPAITVTVPIGVPAVPNPAIDAMKAAGNAEFKAAVRLNAAFRVIEIAYDKIAADGVKSNIKEVFKAIKDEFKKPPDDDAPFKLGFTAARNALANKMKHGMGLVADPPDPEFAGPVLLPPGLRAGETDTEPLFAASGAFANAMDREGSLEGAVLASLEKYQGAAAAQNGRWALAHARGVAHYANLLGDEILRNRPVLLAMKAATQASSFNFDMLLGEERSLQGRLANTGFSPAEKQYLADLGMSEAKMQQSLQSFLARTSPTSYADWIAALDAKIAAASTSSAAMKRVAVEMGPVISALLLEPTLDRDDPVILMGGPFTGAANSPIAFSASATDFHGRDLNFEWDLDGDGMFNDALGATPSAVVRGPRMGFAALRVTNDGGRVAVAYAPLTVTSTNEPPLLAAATPPEAAVEVEVGTSRSFSVTGSDPEGGAVSLRWTLDGTEVATGGSFTFTPVSGQRGLLELAVTATDPSGASRTRVWTVSITKTSPLADLQLSMQAPEVPVQTGAVIMWTMTVENHGPSPAANVVLTHLLPEGLTFVKSSTSFGTSAGVGNQVSAYFGTVAPGGLVTLWVQTTAAAAGTFQSAANAQSDAADLDTTNNNTSARVRVNAPSPQSADIALTVSPLPSPATVGGTQTLTYTTSNAGPDPATGLILETQIPESMDFVSATPAALSSSDGLVRIALPEVASAANTVATVVVRPTLAGSGPAYAQVYAAQGDPVLSNNQTEVLLSAVFVAPPVSDLAVTQTPPTSPRVGLPATWTITVTNNGPATAENVSLQDVLPAGAAFIGSNPAPASLSSAGASFFLGTLANGASRSVSLTVEPPFPGEAVNRVTAASTSRDPNGADSVSTINVQAAPTTSADLSVTLNSAPPGVTLNGQTVLTLTVTNDGPEAATAVSAVTRLPDGLIFVSASAGATHSAGTVTAAVPTLASGGQAVFTINAAAQALRSFAVVSEVHSDNLDPVSNNNRATAAITVQNAPPQAVDLAVTQAARSSVTLGEVVNVVLTVTNRGPGAATGALLTSTLPAGFSFGTGQTGHGSVSHSAGVVTAALGTLAANETATVELVLTAQATGPSILTAAVSAAESEAFPADNVSSLPVTVVPAGPVKLKATYRFDDTLAACEPDAPPIVAIDPSNTDAFATTEVNGRSRRVYRWDGSANPASAQAGLKLNIAGLLPRDNYTVEVLFRFTEDNDGYRSIIHSGNRIGDHSLYVSPSDAIMVYPLANGPKPFVTGTFHHVTLTVAPGGNVTTWLDGELQRSESTSILNISEADFLHLFVDNDQGPAQSEHVDGEIALLRIYEGILPPNRVAAQAAFPFGPDMAMSATADLTATRNPVGVWQSGYSTSRGTPFLVSTDVREIDTRWIFWGGTSNGPFVYYNRLNETVSSQTIRQPPDLLGMDPSLDGRNAVLRWTAPAGGTYRIQGRYQGIDVSPNGTDVALLRNGSTGTTLFEEYVLGYEQRKPFDLTVSVAIGETVDFSVGRGGNSNLFDSTGLDAVVTPLLLTDDCADGTDLAVMHAPMAKTAVPDETFTLELQVTNAGPRPAPNVVLTGSIPAGLSFVSASADNAIVEASGSAVSLALGVMAPGEIRAVSVLLKGSMAGVYTNAVRVSSGSFDPALANNEASAVITVGGVAPLAATVRSTVTSVMESGEAVFELAVTNGGSFAAPASVLSAALPPGTAFVSASNGGTLQNGAIVFPARSLAAGETAGYSVRLRANRPGPLTLTALASSTNPSVRESSGSASINVFPSTVPPDLQVAVSTAPTQLYAGCRFTATYTVTNSSATPAANVTLRGFIPDTLVVISTSASQGTATITGGQLDASLGQVRQGTPVTVSVQALATVAEATGLSAQVSGLHPFATVPAALPASLIHLWDFNEAAGPASPATVLRDRVGSASGLIRGPGALTTGSGVQLPGGSPAAAPYIDLPNGLISPLKQVTFEGWLTINTLGTRWGHIFSFGSSQPGGANGEVTGPGNTNGAGEEGLDLISLTSSIETNDQSQRVAVRNGDPAGAAEAFHDSNSPTVTGQPIHFAVTIDNTTSGRTTLRYYRDGVFKGELANVALNLADLNDVNNWLGRGNWTNYPHVPATYDEFRLYNRVLTESEVQTSRLAGPDSLTSAASGFIDPAISNPTVASTFLRRDITFPPMGHPCAVPVSLRIYPDSAQQSYRLEWDATPTRRFLIQSSPDLQRWINVPALHIATKSLESWTDPGPPSTEITPVMDSKRFYRVLELAD